MNEVNTNTEDYVSWNWKAGGNSNTFNIDGVGYATAAAAGMNTGSISLSGCSVNTESGFSIIKFPGNSTSGATIDHGLGKIPDIAFFKNLKHFFKILIIFFNFFKNLKHFFKFFKFKTFFKIF